MPNQVTADVLALREIKAREERQRQEMADYCARIVMDPGQLLEHLDRTAQLDPYESDLYRTSLEANRHE